MYEKILNKNLHLKIDIIEIKVKLNQNDWKWQILIFEKHNKNFVTYCPFSHHQTRESLSPSTKKEQAAIACQEMRSHFCQF